MKGRLLMLPGWCGSKKSSRLKKYASCCAMHTRYRRLYSGYTSATQAFSPELPELEVTVTTVDMSTNLREIHSEIVERFAKVR